MILLVAATASRSGPPPLDRLHGGDIVTVNGGEVSCVGVSLAATPPPDAEVLLRHDSAVRALMATGPVVPFRYGATVPGVAELRRDLAQWEGRLAEMLELVRGRVEMSVRVTRRSAPADGSPPASGRAYLASLRRREQAGAFATALHRRLAAVSVASETATADGWVATAYLVEAAALAGFRLIVEEATAGEQPERVSVTGPWPPYTFVGVSLAPGAVVTGGVRP